MDNDVVIEKIKKEKGRIGDLAEAIINYKDCSWNNSDKYFNALSSLLMEGNPGTITELYNNGPRKLFACVYGKETADFVGKIMERFNLFVHSPSTWRRSFRTVELSPYMKRITQFMREMLFFAWDEFDIVRDLTAPRNNDDNNESSKNITFPALFYGDCVALYIDEGNKEVINAIKEICLGDNNTKLLNYGIINGIIKSGNRELHKLLGDLLLAAKLQEGLRQSILENADNGRVEAFIYLIKLTLDNDLIRFSSTMRALDVWMGLDEGFEDKRVAAKLLKLGYDCLTDDKIKLSCLKSNDVTEIYAALWALSVCEMNDVVTPIKNLLEQENYKKLTALYFLGQLENKEVMFAVTSSLITSFDPANIAGDLDLLSLTMQHYPVNNHYPWNMSGFAEECENLTFLADKKTREAQFNALYALLPAIPPKGYSSAGKPFPWCSLSINPKDICTRLIYIAGYETGDVEKTARLIDCMPLADSDTRAAFIKVFLDKPVNDAERAFVFTSLNDKSMNVRSQSLINVLGFSTSSDMRTLSDEEEKLILDLLSLKTGDIRLNCLKILLALPGNRPVEAAQTLLSNKNENKRLAGLDILTQLVEGGKLDRSEALKSISLMPAVTGREELLIKTICTETVKYNKSNGFGLYDSGYRPEFPPIVKDKANTVNSIFGIPTERAKKIISSLCDTIREHRDYTYQIENYDGIQDVKLGGLQWPRGRAEVNDKEDEPMFNKFVLQEVWREWMRKNSITFAEVFYFMFIREVKDYNDSYELDYHDWAKKLIEKHFNAKAINAFIHWLIKQEYGLLAHHIIEIIWVEFPEDERFAVLSGALRDLITDIDEEDWKKPVEDDDETFYSYRSKDWEPDTLADTEEVLTILKQLGEAIKKDEHFIEYTAICFELGRLSGVYYKELKAVNIARGINIGILKQDALFRTMFFSSERCLQNYAGKIHWDNDKKLVEEYPILKTVADKVAARVIEIELDRGDSPTEVSSLASKLHWHEGVGTFVKLLTALGDETFVRGYIYDTKDTKKAVLSSLLKASHPAKEDSAETLREALSGTNISEKRLIEAAMYAPSWLDIVGNYLDWPGLKSAAWYFHAHINESFSAEKETEAARYSPISPEEFNDGAFDINWFWDAWNTLGQERFDLVYDCAKYLTEGSNHRRAQLFADAALGRLDRDTLKKEIQEKRNKDKLLGYSLIPLTASNSKASSSKQKEIMTEALNRYEFIQQFLKESKNFGAQRRESEGKVCAIAQDNLARNAGFSDAIRFAWRMETLKIEEIKSYFKPVEREGYLVYLEIDEEGTAILVCENKTKRVSIPAALKKDSYIIALKEVISSLKSQFKRAKASLEQAMVNRDSFEYGELKSLMAHPVVAPLLQKLVFVAVDDKGNPQQSGAFCELSNLADSSPLRIAHPHDLFVLGTWIDCQRYAFENKLIQPFKQIFRELYLINEDEKREKTVSRRYAGHQVQPKKTVALLKSRGWTVDYEDGLQRVYYKENCYATIYAAADWFSPADIEAPTLETVQFFPRRVAAGKEFKPLELESIHPILFSEVMRDADLVVSVAHVGGVDPEASHSTIEMRAAIVRELLALLHIDNAVVEERHATIKGALGEYTVHLGSAQVHKMGKGAVNIIAVPSQHRGRIFLPFADEDPRTAEIMSKIIMLADDKKIKDPAILAQL